jgi:hypothetical protein
MRPRSRYRCVRVAVAAAVAALAVPAIVEAQTVSGRAQVVQVIESTGTSSVLGDTGTLTDPNDARETSQVAGSIASLLQGGTLHAATIGWPDEAASEASIGNLTLTVGDNTIAADFVMSRVRAVQGAAAVGGVNIDRLVINGVLVSVSDAINQKVPINGGHVLINEQQTSSSGTVVNALRVVVGEKQVVIASASAGIQ